MKIVVLLSDYQPLKYHPSGVIRAVHITGDQWREIFYCWIVNSRTFSSAIFLHESYYVGSDKWKRFVGNCGVTYLLNLNI
jgi:hypothetical protein